MWNRSSDESGKLVSAMAPDSFGDVRKPGASSVGGSRFSKEMNSQLTYGRLDGRFGVMIFIFDEETAERRRAAQARLQACRTKEESPSNLNCSQEALRDAARALPTKAALGDIGF